MRILGQNGWPGRGHDAAACLVVDGVLVALAEEERFVRRKHAYGDPPVHAAAFCLAQGGLVLDDVDVVAFGWDIPMLHRDRSLRWDLTPSQVLELLLPAEVLPRMREPELVFVPHHLAHAASVYHLSGDDEASILVLDGQGERESTSLAVGSGGKIRILESYPPSWSFGYLYDAVGQYIGLGPDQAGKTMGLAAYGTPRDLTFGTFRDGPSFSVGHVEPQLRSTRFIDDSAESTAAWLAQIEKVAGRPPNTRRRMYDPRSGRISWRTSEDPFGYADVAATAQAALESLVFGLVGRLVARTGSRTLHLSGGVALNATLNGRLLRHLAVDRVFVQPLAGDAGVALGAAVHVAAEAGDRIVPMSTSIAWGPEFPAGAVRDCLEASGLRYHEPDDLIGTVAARISDGEVFGWFQGRGEVGPRALGHRSILAAPADRAARERVNLRIKNREWWRPLAPMMIEESYADFVDSPVPLPYMITTVDLHPDMRDELAAIDHVDGSTRVQTVARSDEPLCHALLGAVAGHTGKPVLMNTSFNAADEPIVGTPVDAVRTFAAIGLDALAIGPFIVEKR